MVENISQWCQMNCFYRVAKVIFWRVTKSIVFAGLPNEFFDNVAKSIVFTELQNDFYFVVGKSTVANLSFEKGLTLFWIASEKLINRQANVYHVFFDIHKKGLAIELLHNT